MACNMLFNGNLGHLQSSITMESIPDLSRDYLNLENWISLHSDRQLLISPGAQPGETAPALRENMYDMTWR